MSNNLKDSNSDNSFDIEDLFQIEAMRMEGLELRVESLSQARLEDKKYIQKLERQLQNCSEEIGSLQGQLNLRSIEANWLGEHVHSLELKLTDMSKLQENVNQLREELLKSNSECSILRWKIENKEMELHDSKLCIEKLEETILSMSLDSECEIESMKLDLINLEQIFTEAKEFQEKHIREKARLDGLVDEFSAQKQDSQKMIKFLEDEKRDFKEKFEISEQLVHRLKEELKKEKLKAKEEAEDLTQEMAELRYQTSGLLEDERRRRATIEQASLHRISELEAQVQKLQNLTELRSKEINRLKYKLQKNEVEKFGELTIADHPEQRHFMEKSNHEASSQ